MAKSRFNKISEKKIRRNFPSELFVMTIDHCFTYTSCDDLAPIISPCGANWISAMRERSEITDTSSKLSPLMLLETSRLILVSKWLLGSSKMPWCLMYTEEVVFGG